MSVNYFLKTDLILACRNSFSNQWKSFSSIVSDISQECLHPSQWKHIFESRRKSIVFLVETISGNQWKPLSKFYRSLFETLMTVMDNNFFYFSDILANAGSFLVQQKRILKQILHLYQWKPIFCLLETVLFCLQIFFLLEETIRKIQFFKKNLIFASGN